MWQGVGPWGCARMEGRCVASVVLRVGMRAQRDHSRNCWSGLAVVDGAW
jgi:hypothetical protein